jgi:hypothetical protein
LFRSYPNFLSFKKIVLRVKSKFKWFKIDLEVLNLNFNETIVEITILELRNKSSTSLWFFPNFNKLKFVLRKSFKGLKS